MRQMDGIQATEEIRSRFPDAKIIIVTQYNDPKLQQKALRAGACDLVLKEDLLEIERIIRANRN
jgi:DNA-binding NarL/FixJ family response regulator